jgi:hypothetical protein
MNVIIKTIVISLGAVSIAAPNSYSANSVSTSKDTINYEKILSSKGVVRVRVSEMIANDTWEEIVIYNKNGSVYALTDETKQMLTIEDKKYKYKYGFLDEEAFKDELEKKHNFRVKEFLLTGGNIEFECKSIEKDRYEIYINKEKGITKYVKNDKHIYRYEPWSEYLYKHYISFDKNKLMKKENEDVPPINKKELSLYDFKAVEIKDRWMKIKAVSSDCKNIKDSDNIIQGWINWYNGENILIDTYSDCKRQKIKEKLVK